LALNQQNVEFGEVEGTKLYAWVIPSLPQDNSNNIWLLFLHGRSDNVSLSANAYDNFRAMGFNIMAPEYPGYLDSLGVPSEAAVEREARTAYDYLRTVKQVPAKNIVIFGGSLGATFAIDLASRVEAAALVEHAGFTSFVAMRPFLTKVLPILKAFPLLPISALVKNKLESDKKIGRVRMPVLLIHSTEDEVVPFVHAERLYELVPSAKRLVRVRGRHGSGQISALLNPRFFEEIVTFLNAEAGFHLRQPLPSIAPAMAATIDSKGIAAALAQYRSLRDENAKHYNFREPELNYLGYDLLAKKKTIEAIAVFQFNAEQFPESFNAFDSLGDAYVAAGKAAEAMQSYRQSVTLFPDASNFSRPKLDQLQQKSQGR